MERLNVRGAPVVLATPAYGNQRGYIKTRLAANDGMMERARMRLGCQPRGPGRTPGCGNPARVFGASVWRAPVTQLAALTYLLVSVDKYKTSLNATIMVESTLR